MAKLNRDGYPEPDVYDEDYKPSRWQELVGKLVNVLTDEAGYPITEEDN